MPVRIGRRVAHLGLHCDRKTREAVEYLFKVPEDIAVRLVIVIDRCGHRLLRDRRDRPGRA